MGRSRKLAFLLVPVRLKVAMIRVVGIGFRFVASWNISVRTLGSSWLYGNPAVKSRLIIKALKVYGRPGEHGLHLRAISRNDGYLCSRLEGEHGLYLRAISRTQSPCLGEHGL